MTKIQPELPSRFKLDGQSNELPSSQYVQETLEKIKRKNRLWLVGLGGIVVLFFIWGVRSQFQLNKAQKALQETESLSKMTAILDKELAINRKIMDSLQLSNSKLKSDNDLLLENSDRTDGIFFEVQIGSFKDFDIDQYNANLASLRSIKHDGKSKLVLGKFRSFQKALLFENDMKRVGISGAFIVGRVDGEIVPYQDALKMLKQK